MFMTRTISKKQLTIMLLFIPTILILPLIANLAVNTSPTNQQPLVITPMGQWIDGDSSLAANADSGSGTENDPYRIEMSNCDGGGNKCLEIKNTQAHFELYNGHFHNSKIALYLEKVSNGIIHTFTIQDNSEAGIELRDCDHITIRDSNIESSETGIMISNSDNIIVTRCNILNNRVGIFLLDSTDNVITYNTFEGNNEGVLETGSSSNNQIDFNRGLSWFDDYFIFFIIGGAVAAVVIVVVIVKKKRNADEEPTLI